MADWTFLSKHATALACVEHDPGMTLRQIGDALGVTERTAHSIIRDLVEDGYVERYREGNRNRYKVDPKMPLRDPLLRDQMVGEILGVLALDKTALTNGGSGQRRGGRSQRGSDRVGRAT